MFKNKLAYEASAGSGKTFMLVVRYLSLLFLGAKPSRILALTFTNKAAGEMQHRVFETLQNLHQRDELFAIAEVLECSPEEILSKRQSVLDEFLNTSIKMMTIDKFLTQILRKFSLYVSLMPDFTTSESQHELKLLDRFLKELSVTHKKNTFVTLALKTGKKIEDIIKLLDNLYNKKQELANAKFQTESYEQYEQNAMESLQRLQKIVLDCEEASATAKSGVEAQSFYELRKKAWLSRDTMNYSTFKKCYTSEMDIILGEIKSNVAKYYKAKEQNFFHSLFELVSIYEKAKKSLYVDENELSFSDVSALVYHILKEIDDSEFLYFRLDAQIEHILLDEYQDTSILQYEILKPLIEEISSGNGIFENGSFFFVGDVKQSIYRFRGGVSALFSHTQKEHDVELEKLLVNYRSQYQVVTFVNQTFASVINNYFPQRVKDGNDGGYVEVIYNDEIVAQALEYVQKLIEAGADLNDIAILCVANKDGEIIKQALGEQNIEVVTETKTKLIHQKSVEAILEYLKYLYFHEEIYRKNFFALINQEVQFIEKIDLKEHKLLEIVKNAIAKYKLFEGDFQLLRFLDVVENFKDVEALLFEYERIDTEAASLDLKGVRVLTVHKSKGLEYPHVIVIDRLKKPRNGGDAIIYDYDGICLQNLYLRDSGREAVDAEYVAVLEKEKKLSLEDTLNTLYVAFTRAKENLFVVAKSKDSLFEPLNLENTKLGTFGVNNSKKVSSSPTLLESFTYKDLYYGTQSDILALEEELEENLQSIHFGLAMHYTLEMLESFHESSLENALAMTQNKYGLILQNGELEDIEQRVRRLLNSKDFHTLLNETVCYKEKAIRYKNNLRYIDLLVKSKKENLWKIIDYKSSLNYSSHHLSQVRFYNKAIQEITGEEVKGYLCYLLENEVKIVEV